MQTRSPFRDKVRKGLKYASKLFSKVICIFDDIPFLLTLKNTGNVGPFLLVAAGLLMFPIAAYDNIKKLRKALREDERSDEIKIAKQKALLRASVIKLALAIIGFAASVCLLAFILTNLFLLAAIASVAIPCIMAIVGGIELIQDIHALQLAERTKKGVAEAKREVAYSTAFFIFGVAIAALATLSVLTGLSVVSLGLVPAAVLIAVVITALVVKIYQIADTKKIKDDNDNTIEIAHPVTEWLKKQLRALHHAFNPDPKIKISSSTAQVHLQLDILILTPSIHEAKHRPTFEVGQHFKGQTFSQAYHKPSQSLQPSSASPAQKFQLGKRNK